MKIYKFDPQKVRMKMKKYRIWLTNDQIIEITAKSIEVDYHHLTLEYKLAYRT